MRIISSRPTAGEHNDPLTVEVSDNSIYFYSEVDPDRCLALLQDLNDLDQRFTAEQIKRDVDAPTPIWLHVQSAGGDLMAALAVVDQLPKLHVPVYSIAEGMVASAATLITMACTKRYATPSAMFCIHQLSSSFWGKHEDFKDQLVLQDKLMEIMVGFYVKRSKMREGTVRKMLQRDSWLTAAEAVKLGVVDGIR